MKTKYDCSYTLDFGHEYKRMCDSVEDCLVCPLKGGCSFCPTQEMMDAVQKWSDENPEPPKLTKKDKEFLDSFVFKENKKIAKVLGSTILYTENGEGLTIDNCLFSFLEPDEQVTFKELLALEVED